MQPDNYHWFDLNFPWIGIAGAAIMLILLFRTNLFRSNHEISKWQDITWLSWLGFTAYLIHNGEEYGIDLNGHIHAFPEQFCNTVTKVLGITDCSVPPAFYLAVNITLFWIIVPLGAIMSRQHPLTGLAIYSVIFINGLIHILPLLIGTGYGPGAFTALILFLPISVWVGYACFGKGKLPYASIVVLIILGLILHAILMSSLVAFLTGRISSILLILIQIFNAILLLLLTLIAERLIKR
ncbi:HXXEE domain-containing protein [Emticicia sp. BO119]|uniref:HXXEE domain-containing protein n=1 Tax=Emticicia sp. BO119 TaxID=2757768 RepID=UPI0015F02622|nr:HXXEE domain-containing protein [Emticicia sp. BO119]MBA4849198.1 HXXEE domain-containing protein [Emticicia sp. BO119]